MRKLSSLYAVLATLAALELASVAPEGVWRPPKGNTAPSARYCRLPWVGMTYQEMLKNRG